MSNQSPFILVDGSSYLYRAFHALPPLTNSKGQPTGAVYGVVNMLRRLMLDYQPTHMAVVFDAKGKTFRHDLYADYKATRPPMPDELRSQIEPLHQVIKAMGLPLLIVEGVEADDVIGTLAAQATNAKMDTLISTGDKDMAQLVNEHVTLINTMSNQQLDVDGVVNKFGVKPEQIVDYLTLMGDKVDNVPGVEKCGPKTAVKWLTQYQTLDGVIAHAEQITGKVGEHLQTALSQLPLSQALVTIKTDVVLGVAPNELNCLPEDKDALIALFTELEFKSWLNEQLQDAAPAAVQDTDYETVLTEEAFTAWMKTLSSADVFAFDLETTSLNYMQAEIVGLSFSAESGKAAYVPVAHNYLDAPEQLSRDWVLAQLKPLLESDEHHKVGQHMKYDMNVLKRYDIELRGVQFDTMLESYCLNSIANRHDMDTLALKYLGRSTIHFEDVAGKGAKQLCFDQVVIDVASEYAAEDADVTLQLHQTLFPKLQEHSGPLAVYQQLEVPLIPILSTMETTGVLVDVNVLRTLSIELHQSCEILREQAFQIAGETFNLDSPKQLQQILFEKLGLPVIKKTPKGQPSTAEPILQQLAYEYELPKIIMNYRSANKLKNTYTDKLPELVDAKTGRIHTSYNQTVASTGRLSSSDPNLQNIPIKNEQGRKIRAAFIAPEGYQLVAADYSQVELRIMAHLSQDEMLLQAFAKGLDIHRATAAEVFGVAVEDVTSDMRRKAKAINFGLIYGMSAFGLAKQIQVGRAEAQEYIDIYFHRYPGVKAYMDRMRAHAHETGYVETLMGRRLYLPEINSKNKMRQMAAERVAINAPMQGTAADIIKKAMIDVNAWLAKAKIDAKMILQVHDELVLEVADADVPLVKRELPHIMSGCYCLNVPLEVSVGTGRNWNEAH